MLLINNVNFTRNLCFSHFFISEPYGSEFVYLFWETKVSRYDEICLLQLFKAEFL